MSAINKLIGALSGTRFAGSGAAMVGALAAFAGMIPASSAWAQTPAPAGVKISQVFTAGNLAGSICASDFVELHNSGASPANIGGWQLCYSTSTTGSISIPDALNRRVNFSAGTVIPAGGYLLVQLVPSTSVNLAIKPDAVAQDTIDLQDSGNFVLLNQPLQAGTASISPTDSRIQDRISWGQGVFPETTAAGAPGTKALCRKNQGARDTNNNSADFFLADPSPRSTLIRTASRYDDFVGLAGWTTAVSPLNSTSVDFAAVSGMWSLTAYSGALISASRAFDVPAGVGSDLSIGFKPNFMDNAPEGAAARLEFLSASNTVMLCLEAKPSNGSIAYQLLECTGTPRASFQSDVRVVKFVVAVREGQYSVCWECQGGVTGAWNETGAGAGTAISKIRVVNANAGDDSRVSFDDVRVEDAVLTRLRGFQNPNGYDVDCPVAIGPGAPPEICAHFNVTSGVESPRGDLHIPSGTLVRGVRVKLANLKDTLSPQNLRIVLKRWEVGADTETEPAIATASLVPAITTYNRKFNGDYRFADTAVANLKTAAGLAATQQASTILQSIYFPLSDQSGDKDPLNALIGLAGSASGHWGVEVTDGSNPNATINGVDLELVLAQDFDLDGLPDSNDPCPLYPGVKVTYYLDADFDDYTAMSAPGSSVPATAEYCPGEQPNTYDAAASSQLDCDDDSDQVHPGAPELCATKGVDNNCNGTPENPDLDEVDANAIDKVTYYLDADLDNYTAKDADGNAVTAKFCEDDQPGTYDAAASSQLDCNDLSATVYPGAPELCATKGVDNNCNGTPENPDLDEVDANAIDKVTYYLDADLDNYTAKDADGNAVTAKFCEDDQPATYDAAASSQLDCNDLSATVYPGAPELCATKGVDNNCNGTPENPDLDEVDANAIDKVTYYLDADLDNYTAKDADGNAVTAKFCEDDQPGTYDAAASSQLDCNDLSATVYPGAPELCATKGVDNNCNGTPENPDLDEVDANAIDKVTYYLDADLDNYTAKDADGNAVTAKFCEDDQPGTYDAAASSQLDCNDLSATVYPGAPELCATKGVDNNCNGTPENPDLDEVDANAIDKVTYYLDADLDNYTAKDADGNAVTAKFCEDDQPDTYDAAASSQLDCNDVSDQVYPGAPELCATKGVDNNCNGTPENPDLDEVDANAIDKVTYYLDADLDNYTAKDADGNAVTAKFCEDDQPDTYDAAASSQLDCNDGSDQVYPGAPELCATKGVDNNCNGTPENPDLDEVDANAIDKVTYYLDADLDNYTAKDADGNAVTAKFCEDDQPDTYDAAASSQLDCNDGSDQVYPGAPELCATKGVDNNCNGTPENPDLDEVDANAIDKVTYYLDADLDNYTAKDADGNAVTAKFCEDDQPDTYDAAASSQLDCNDGSDQVYPGAPELCATKGVDNNCNGTPENPDLDEVDANAIDKVTYYLDADLDNYTAKDADGNAVTARYCEDDQPDTYDAAASSQLDCNDGSDQVYPGAPELCATKGTDNNCNWTPENPDLDEVDANAIDKVTYYLDADLDNYTAKDADGNAVTARYCEDDQPDTYDAAASSQLDCNDGSDQVYPGAPELCATKGTDNNCNWTPENPDLDEVDANAIDKVTYYLDADLDNYTAKDADGNAVTEKFCQGEQPDTYDAAASSQLDCDDANAAAYPLAAELCSTKGTDNNCDGVASDVDEGAADKVTYYVDQDADNYAPEDPAHPGHPMSARACERPQGYVSEENLEPELDCADLKFAVNPGAREDCANMGIDNNCNDWVDDGVTINDVVVPDDVPSTREALLAKINEHLDNPTENCFAFTGVIDIDTTWDDPAGDLALLASFIKESAPISAQVNVDSSQMTEDDDEWTDFIDELSALVVDSTLALDGSTPGSPAIRAVGDVFEIGVSIHNMPCPAVGVFATLNYDPEVLEPALDEGESIASAIVPSAEFSELLFAQSGERTIDARRVGYVKFSTGVCDNLEGAQNGFVTAPVASVRFRVKAPLCRESRIVWVQSEGGNVQFESRISSRGANPGDPVVPIPHALVNKSVFAALNGLHFENLPADDEVVPADAGRLGAYFENPVVVAKNLCGDDVSVTMTVTHPDRSVGSSWPAGGIFGVGVTTVTWEASDVALPITATRTYTVEDYQLAKVQVKLVGGSMDPYRSFCQELRVKVWPLPPRGSPTITTLVEAGVDPCPDQIDPLQPFVHFEQSSVTLPEHALLADEAIMKIAPAGEYSCMWVKDPKHTLGKRKSLIALPAVDSSGRLLRPAGERYYVAASATAPESFDLIGGDATDDNLVDVLDFGAWVTDRSRPGNWQRNPWDRSNFNRDLCVGNADFAFIAAGSQFLRAGDGECGASNLAGDDTPMPRERVSVKELRRLGLGELAEADVNGDGWIDQTDMAIVIQGGTQGTRAPQAGSERGLHTRW